MTEERRRDIARLARDQWRIAVRLTVAMMAVYFGFTLLVAYDKPLLGREIVPGLSVGILLGALVIVAAWGFVWIYVRWANRHFDVTVDRLRRERP
jgi:uncharacterized membrane protein (DUF485 family)